MNAVAFAVPGQPGWRWRIVDYNGQTVEESDAVFGTMALALVECRERLRHRPERDAPMQRKPNTWTSQPRRLRT